MYEQFGAVVEGSSVEFRLFFPNRDVDSRQYSNGGLPRIKKIQIVGDFPSRLGLRDWDVDTAPYLALGPHPQGMLFTQLPAADTPHGEFTLHSFLHALRYYAALFSGDTASFSPCGLLQLHGPRDAAGLARLGERFAAYPRLVRVVNAAEASALAGVALAHGGLHLPGSGWIVPPAACARALDHPLIETRPGCRASALAADEPGWRVHVDGGETLHATAVIVATAVAAIVLLIVGFAWGLLPAVLTVAVLVYRTHREDKTLQAFRLLRENGIEVVEACTLVMLRTNQY